MCASVYIEARYLSLTLVSGMLRFLKCDLAGVDERRRRKKEGKQRLFSFFIVYVLCVGKQVSSD